MTNRAPAPTVADLREIGEGLIKHWPGARSRLRIYADGISPWSMSHRDIKELLKEMIASYRSGVIVKVPMRFREKAMAFAAQYGTETRTTASEPLSVKRDMRFTATEYAVVLAAAERQGVTPAYFIRAAAVAAAERTEGTT